MFKRILFLLVLSLFLVSGWQLLPPAGAASGALERGNASVTFSDSVLFPSDSASEHSFGQSVSISGEWALVGAGEDSKGSSDAGAAYMYHWDGDIWQEFAKLEASDGEAGDGFGRMVSMSGEVALIGAPFDDDHATSSGAAYLFRFDGESWQEEAKLTVADGAEFDRFGIALSISDDVAFIGVPFHGAGTVYSFRFDGSMWQQEAVLSNQGGFFGRSVSVNGDVALIGTNTSVIVYRFVGSSWQEEQVLAIGDSAASSLSLSDSVALIGTERGEAGAAYLFRFDGNEWQEERLFTPSETNGAESFGAAVALSDTLALIGMPSADDLTGAAIMYRFDGSSWQEEATFKPNDGATPYRFAHTVSLSGENLLIGALFNDSSSDSGRAYLYDLASEALSFQIFLPLLLKQESSPPTTPTVTATVTATATPAPPVPDHRLGVVQTYDAPELATTIGAGWTRVYFSWDKLQPDGAGTDLNSFYFPSEVMQQEFDANRELVGLLIETASWASQNGGPRDVPSGLYLPYDDANNWWGQFVKKIVEQYKGKIDDWIIWNEPDICHNEQNTQSWNGSVQDYVQLLKVAYQAAKSVNPNAKIVIAATTYWWDIEICGRQQHYLTSILETMQQDPVAVANNGFFDTVAVNLYYDPDQIYNIMTFYGQQSQQYGFSNKKLWLTETNAPPTTDEGFPRPALCFEAADRCFDITLEEQSHYLLQGWPMAMAAGAERLQYYKIIDAENPPPDGPFGILRQDGSLRPVSTSYQTAVRYLSGFENATYTQENDIRRVVVSRGERGTTTVLWNMGLNSQIVTVAANTKSAFLVEPDGKFSTITPSDGLYSINLEPKAEEWDKVGGKPLLLVEE